MSEHLCTMSMFLNKAEFEAAKVAAKSCACTQCKAERHDYMKGALEEIKYLLSAQANDGFSLAVKESNANQAWHRAYTTLNAIDPTAPLNFGSEPAYLAPSQAKNMTITDEMIEAGAMAIAPEVWATDVALFGHPDSLTRRGHEQCKSMVRAQASACLSAALSLEQSGSGK